ncbi:histidine phosphatase family protein, partial [Patescibacteria group bacterium]|nr:histidine phosphatase family protein [Patescibacteria group bacterium]
NKTVVVVTHGGAIKALIPLLLKVSKEESFKHVPGNASLTIFDFDDKGFHQITVNDASHLFEK